MPKNGPTKYIRNVTQDYPACCDFVCSDPAFTPKLEGPVHEQRADVSHKLSGIDGGDLVRRSLLRFERGELMGLKSSKWRWHLDEVFVKINSERHYHWRAVDDGILESVATKSRDKKAALKLLRKAMRKHQDPELIVAEQL